LVRLVENDRMRLTPAYHQRGFTTATNEIWVRAGVASALNSAAQSLPHNIYLLVWDGLRTLATQQEIIDCFMRSLAHLDPAQREETCRRYVSPLPKTQTTYQEAPPPHSTGGAVDVTLCGLDGTPFDLGADFDEFDDVAWLTFFETRSAQSAAQSALHRNRRRILYWAMVGAGFAPYKWEFWHYELGTRRAVAAAGGREAVYAGVAPWPTEWLS
jgi:zinc D-Ala-D-Ala dipeptidase